MELNESIKQALNDSEVKKAIKDQIDLVTESKANERVQSLLKEKTNELEILCEDYKKELAKNNQSVIEESVNKKITELNEHCENFKKQLQNDYNRKLKELSEKLSQYTDEVVEDFLNKHKQAFMIHQNQMKTNSILEALSAVCAVAGVRAEQITQGTNYLSNKDVLISEQRIENLKSQLQLAEQDNNDIKKENADLSKELQDKETQIVNVQNETEKEQQKNKELEEALKDFVRKHKISESENQDLKDKLEKSETDLDDSNEKIQECLKTIKALKAELSEAKQSIKDLEQKSAQTLKKAGNEIQNLRKVNESLNSENNKILKMGVIAEMKQGMTLTESKKFEQIAEQIPFAQNKEYFQKLEILKDELLNNPKYKKLNEVTGNEEPEESEETLDLSRWDHLI